MSNYSVFIPIMVLIFLKIYFCNFSIPFYFFGEMSRERIFKIYDEKGELAIISVSGDYANVFVKVKNPRVKVLLLDDWAEEQVITTDYED
jgi:hypothetical protein